MSKIYRPAIPVGLVVDEKPIGEITGAAETASTTDAVKHGHWIGKPIAGYCTVRCSVCGEVLLANDGRFPYCPWCGAKMDGKSNDLC